jgi:hypothetical protein
MRVNKQWALAVSMSGRALSRGLSPCVRWGFPAISHAHAETVLRRFIYCRFRFDVRMSLVSGVLEAGGVLAARRMTSG